MPLFFMTNIIQLDVREYLEIHYPKLSLEEIDLIASDIHRRWDYTPLKSQVREKIEETAYYANIKLHDDVNFNRVEDDIDEGFVHSSEGC